MLVDNWYNSHAFKMSKCLENFHGIANSNNVI